MADSAPDPARLTDKQIEEAKAAAQEDWDNDLIPRGTHGLIDSLADALKADRARLAAAENVVEAARTVSDSPAGRRYGFLPLLNALAAYDAQKEKPRLSDLMRERYPDGLDAHKGKP